MRPRPGISLDSTIQQLRALTNASAQTADHDLGRSVNSYLSWISSIEAMLRFSFERFRITQLHTNRFWHIQAATDATPRAHELIRNETELQRAWLSSVVDALTTEQLRHAGQSGVVIGV